MPEAIKTEIISRNYDYLLADHFGIMKTHELIAHKYNWRILRYNVKHEVKGYNASLALKRLKHNPSKDFQFLPVPIYCWIDLFIDFMTDLPITTYWKTEFYDSILVIVN